MKNTILYSMIAFALVVLIATLSVLKVAQDNKDAAQIDWNNMVKTMSIIPSCEGGIIKMTLVNPPSPLSKQSPRILLFGQEIKRWDGVSIEVKTDKVVVRYNNEIIGTCAPLNPEGS